MFSNLELFFLSVLKLNDGYQCSNSQNVCQKIVNKEGPADQTASEVGGSGFAMFVLAFFAGNQCPNFITSTILQNELWPLITAFV